MVVLFKQMIFDLEHIIKKMFAFASQALFVLQQYNTCFIESLRIALWCILKTTCTNIRQGERSDNLKTALETSEMHQFVFIFSKQHTSKLVKLSYLWSPNRFFQFLIAS